MGARPTRNPSPYSAGTSLMTCASSRRARRDGPASASSVMRCCQPGIHRFIRPAMRAHGLDLLSGLAWARSCTSRYSMSGIGGPNTGPAEDRRVPGPNKSTLLAVDELLDRLVWRQASGRVHLVGDPPAVIADEPRDLLGVRGRWDQDRDRATRPDLDAGGQREPSGSGPGRSSQPLPVLDVVGGADRRGRSDAQQLVDARRAG